MLTANINGKRFRSRSNKEGIASEETIFFYHVHADLITGTYSGGGIRAGQIVGRVIDHERIELRFQCLTSRNELFSGESEGSVWADEKGRIHLSFNWAWLPSVIPGESSEYIEMN